MNIKDGFKRAARIRTYENPFESLAGYLDSVAKSTSLSVREKESLFQVGERKAKALSAWIKSFDTAEQIFNYK